MEKKQKRMRTINKISRRTQFKMAVMLIVVIGIISAETFSYGIGQPLLVRKLRKAFEQIYSYILAVSTPAAAVSVATGLIMKKFSFGEEERVRTAKRLIRGTLFAYGFILCSKLVIDLITALLK